MFFMEHRGCYAAGKPRDKAPRDTYRGLFRRSRGHGDTRKSVCTLQREAFPFRGYV